MEPSDKKIDVEFLKNDLKDTLQPFGSRVEGDKVVLDLLNVAIVPRLYEMDSQSNALICQTGYYVSSPEWGSEIYDTSVGVGKDEESAVKTSQTGFLYALMDTVIAMKKHRNPERVTSRFAGKRHGWNAYLGNIVAMGGSRQVDMDFYWKALKNKIAERIGNQKIVPVKIYVSTTGKGEVTAECRINNIIQHDLSEMLHRIAEKIEIDHFMSEKQYIILEQDKDTVIDYPYTELEISEKVSAAMQLYEKCNEEDSFDTFNEQFTEVVQEDNLILEILKFVPEICAEYRFDALRYPDTINMLVREIQVDVYKTQIYSYAPIYNGVMKTLQGGLLNDAEKVFEAFVQMSSLFETLGRAMEDGADPQNLGVMDLIYSMDERYVLR